MIESYRQAKRVITIVVGVTVLLIGIIMLPLPGPGFLIILGALTILAAEFIWAKRLLFRLKKTAAHIKSPRRSRLFFFAKAKIIEKFLNLFKRKQAQ